MKKLSKKEGINVIGTVTIRVYKAGTKELIREIVQRNMIMQSSYRGKDLLAKRLVGDITYTGILNYGAIGTGSTAVTASDTQLATESARTTVSLSQTSGFNQASLQFFFPNSVLSNTTYREFGTFVDGSSGANTGQMFNRALFAAAYTKGAGTDTTVQVDISFA